MMLHRIDTVCLQPLLSRHAEDPSLLSCRLLLYTALVAVYHDVVVVERKHSGRGGEGRAVSRSTRLN